MRRVMTTKLLVFGAILCALAAFLLFDLDRYLTLEFFHQSRQELERLYAERPLTMLGSYMALYVCITALSLPGAALTTLAGAALFGFWPALVAVSFASTIGATLACFVSRFLLRDWVQRRFRERLVRVNRGIAEEGGFYLFTLRLVPVFPFFIINLVMGLTPMPLRTFYWVSQLGMLPGTMVYVNAGKELGKLESLSGIFSPSLLLSFALLGLFPLATKKLLQWHRSRKAGGAA